MRHVFDRMGLMTVAVVLSGLIAGCGGKASETVGEKLAEKALEEAIEASGGEKVDVDVAEDSLSIKVEDEGVELVMGEQVDVPDDFPKDVPIYPGAKVFGAISLKEDQQFTVQAKTSDSPDKVVDYYQKELAGNGWIEEMTMSQPELKMLTYSKDGRTVSAMVAKEDEGTVITLTVGKR